MHWPIYGKCKAHMYFYVSLYLKATLYKYDFSHFNKWSFKVLQKPKINFFKSVKSNCISQILWSLLEVKRKVGLSWNYERNKNIKIPQKIDTNFNHIYTAPQACGTQIMIITHIVTHINSNQLYTKHMESSEESDHQYGLKSASA